MPNVGGQGGVFVLMQEVVVLVAGVAGRVQETIGEVGDVADILREDVRHRSCQAAGPVHQPRGLQGVIGDRALVEVGDADRPVLNAADGAAGVLREGTEQLRALHRGVGQS